MPPELIAEQESGAVRLTLNRPDRRNALTPELIGQLLEALERIEADPGVRVAVVTGAGGAFCSGFDIAHIESPGDAEAGVERDLVEKLSASVRGLRVPVIAKVNGVASGAGCDLAVSCDLRLASEDARLGMPPARLGLLYSFEGMARLVAVVGSAAAREMLLSGELVTAARALEIGLVNRVCPPDRLDAETAALVEVLRANAPLSVQASKLVLNALGDGAPLPEEARAAIDEAMKQVWMSEDSREGPRAYLERRPPRFVGR